MRASAFLDQGRGYKQGVHFFGVCHATPSHLRLSRCGIYQFRLVLPDNLAAIVGQKCIILQSLGAKRPEQARMAAYRLSARIIPFLRALRRTVAFDSDSIDPKNVRELIVNLYLSEAARSSRATSNATAALFAS